MFKISGTYHDVPATITWREGQGFETSHPVLYAEMMAFVKHGYAEGPPGGPYFDTAKQKIDSGIASFLIATKFIRDWTLVEGSPPPLPSLREGAIP